MKYIQRDSNGNIIACSDVEYPGFEAANEEYNAGFDGKIYSASEMQGADYTTRKAAFDKAQELRRLNAKYIPDITASMTVLLKSYLKSNLLQEVDEKLKVSGLYDEWVAGSYEVGDIRNYGGQTWECWTAHDNAIYPDINPDNPQTWANFWRPLHGKSVETARPWTKPRAGTTDMYHAGEYMVYTDGKIYKCNQDTPYSPEEYAAAWTAVA